MQRDPTRPVFANPFANPFATPGAALACAVLVGCAGLQPPAEAPAPAPQTPANQRAAAPAALNTERQWLQSWFKGTPVLIEQAADGGTAIEVPLEFSFKAGAAAVQPALAAVLDKVAESLRRVPSSSLVRVAAPGDGDSASATNKSRDVTLALQRAAAVRERLRSRGVPSARLAQPSAASAAAVQLHIDAALP